MNNPTEEHMKVVYRILRYLKMTPEKGLLSKKNEGGDAKVFHMQTRQELFHIED